MAWKEVIVACFKIRRSHLHRRIRENNNGGNVRKHIKLRRIRLTIVGLEKQILLHIMTVCVLIYPARKPHASQHTLSSVWPDWLYHIFPHHLINGKVSKKKLLNIQLCYSEIPSLLHNIFILKAVMF